MTKQKQKCRTTPSSPLKMISDFRGGKLNEWDYLNCESLKNAGQEGSNTCFFVSNSQLNQRGEVSLPLIDLLGPFVWCIITHRCDYSSHIFTFAHTSCQQPVSGKPRPAPPPPEPALSRNLHYQISGVLKYVTKGPQSHSSLIYFTALTQDRPGCYSDEVC